MGSVDVVIPNYNYARWLPDAIDSALSQREVDVRVVVVDNASTDDSIALVEEAMAREPRLHLIKHPENLGLIASLNDGVDWCTGDYTVNLSADDMLTPGSLRRAVTVLDAHPETAFVYGPVTVYREGAPEPRRLPTRDRAVTRIWDGDAWLGQAARSGHVCIHSPEVVARTSLVQEVHYAPELPHTSDIGMWLRLAARGAVGHLRGVRQAVYRVHGDSMMHSVSDPVISAMTYRLDAFEVLAEQDAERLANAGELLRQARAALATEGVLTALYEYDRRRETDTALVDKLLQAAESIWPEVTAAPVYRTLAQARARSGWSATRAARYLQANARARVRHVRCRQFGQWPAYVSR